MDLCMHLTLMKTLMMKENMTAHLEIVEDCEDMRVSLIVKGKFNPKLKKNSAFCTAGEKIELSGEKFLMISIYCPPSEELGENINEITTLLLRFPQEKIVILDDFNAKSSIWDPRNTDERENIVHDLINQFDLVVINDRDSPPLFNGPCGISWIDTMMVKNIGVDTITEWKISDRITLSDHQIMEFKIEKENFSNKRKTCKWSIENINLFDFKIKVNQSVERCKTNYKDSNKNLNEMIKEIHHILANICFETRKRNRAKKKKNKQTEKRYLVEHRTGNIKK
ncbi:hypothetical protein AVEN_12453-1 [Araneus ventricosus]|uniref:Endonuclease/exonuclease/phosphatase domain-containing protein n=1 Tax=Araneus ventricosus TaxID=182803 RepID=A0A4Y2MXV2_ARAVE|nr:hypothetical protein AVEN_12453-1 [Araneus ventricosus]